MNLPRRVLFITALLFTSPLRAPCQDTGSAITQANREIGVSFAPSLIAYREYQENGKELDSEHGWISGLGAKASVEFNALKMTNLLCELAYQYNNGASKHWSENLSGPGTLQYQAPFKSNDVRFGIGKSFAPNSRLTLAPEAEFEYREWDRGLPRAELSIKETYTFWAPGGAISANLNPIRLLVVRARAGVAHTVFPQNEGIGNPLNDVPDVTFPLGSRFVWQADLGTDYAIYRRVHAFADIAYSHFGFGRSASVSYGNGHSEYEPDSVTDLAKVNVGLAWSF